VHKAEIRFRALLVLRAFLNATISYFSSIQTA